MRSVDGRRRVLIQTGMFDVADNADDCSPRVVIDRPLHPEPLPDRVFIRPVPARHRIVDNPNGHGFFVILFGEDSPSYQWDADSLKQIWGHNPIIYPSQRLIRCLLSFNIECPGKIDAAQGEGVYCACRIHSWKRIEFFRKALIKTASLWAEFPR